tara:strand:- start:191 stop:466 length:276 start_codon:yes stop_codon:yes gene_type:complete
MSDDRLLNKKQQEELQKIIDEITQEAKSVIEDYAKNPSDMSGSVHPTEGKVKGVGVMVGMDSDYLDETKEMDGDKVIEINKEDLDGNTEKE